MLFVMHNIFVGMQKQWYPHVRVFQQRASQIRAGKRKQMKNWLDGMYKKNTEFRAWELYV